MYYNKLILFLDTAGYLIFPGIGEFSIKEQPAKLSMDKSQVLPPISALLFSNKIVSDFNEQSSFLAEQWDVGRVKALAIQHFLSADILSSMSKNESVLLPRLGDLSTNEGGFVFRDNGDFDKRHNFYEKPLQVSTVYAIPSSFTEQESIAPIDKSDYIVSRPKYYKWVAALLLLFIVGYSSLSIIDATKRDRSLVNYNLNGVSYDESKINRSPESDGSEANIDRLIDEDSGFRQELHEKNKNNEIDEIDVLTDIVSEDIELKPEHVDETNNTQHQNESVVSNHITINGCIYIVGSFRAVENVRLMKNRLIEKGFDIYESNNNDVTRVGVVLPCEDNISLEKLLKLQKGAWLLK